jgi:hypothetical protein
MTTPEAAEWSVRLASTMGEEAAALKVLVAAGHLAQALEQASNGMAGGAGGLMFLATEMEASDPLTSFICAHADASNRKRHEWGDDVTYFAALPLRAHRSQPPTSRDQVRRWLLRYVYFPPPADIGSSYDITSVALADPKLCALSSIVSDTPLESHGPLPLAVLAAATSARAALQAARSVDSLQAWLQHAASLLDIGEVLAIASLASIAARDGSVGLLASMGRSGLLIYGEFSGPAAGRLLDFLSPSTRRVATVCLAIFEISFAILTTEKSRLLTDHSAQSDSWHDMKDTFASLRVPLATALHMALALGHAAPLERLCAAVHGAQCQDQSDAKKHAFSILAWAIELTSAHTPAESCRRKKALNLLTVTYLSLRQQAPDDGPHQHSSYREAPSVPEEVVTAHTKVTALHLCNGNMRCEEAHIIVAFLRDNYSQSWLNQRASYSYSGVERPPLSLCTGVLASITTIPNGGPAHRSVICEFVAAVLRETAIQNFCSGQKRCNGIASFVLEAFPHCTDTTLWQQHPTSRRSVKQASQHPEIDALSAAAFGMAHPVAAVQMLKVLEGHRLTSVMQYQTDVPDPNRAVASDWYRLHCLLRWLRVAAGNAPRALPIFVEGLTLRPGGMFYDDFWRAAFQSRNHHGLKAFTLTLYCATRTLFEGLAGQPLDDALGRELHGLLSTVALCMHPTTEAWDDARMARSRMPPGVDVPVALEQVLTHVLSVEWGTDDEFIMERRRSTKPLFTVPMLRQRVGLALHAGELTTAVALCVHVAREPTVWRTNATILWFLQPTLAVFERLICERSPLLSVELVNAVCHAVIAVDWLGSGALASAACPEHIPETHGSNYYMAVEAQYGPPQGASEQGAGCREPTQEDVDLLIAASQRCSDAASSALPEFQSEVAEALAVLSCLANLCTEWMRLCHTRMAKRPEKRSRSRAVPHLLTTLLDEAESFAKECGAHDALNNLRWARDHISSPS